MSTVSSELDSGRQMEKADKTGQIWTGRSKSQQKLPPNLTNESLYTSALFLNHQYKNLIKMILKPSFWKAEVCFLPKCVELLLLFTQTEQQARVTSGQRHPHLTMVKLNKG